MSESGPEEMKVLISMKESEPSFEVKLPVRRHIIAIPRFIRHGNDLDQEIISSTTESFHLAFSYPLL